MIRTLVSLMRTLDQMPEEVTLMMVTHLLVFLFLKILKLTEEKRV